MSEVPENYSETTEFERELILLRLKGAVELASERFRLFGEKLQEFRQIIHNLDGSLDK